MNLDVEFPPILQVDGFQITCSPFQNRCYHGFSSNDNVYLYELHAGPPDADADAGCHPIPPGPGDTVTCYTSLEVDGDRVIDEEHTATIPVADTRIVPIAKISDIGITETPDATLTIEQGLLRTSILGFPIDQTLVTPRIDGEPDPTTLDQDLGPISTTYTHVQDLCIDDTCAFTIGAELGEGLKVGELWESELQILVNGEIIVNAPLVEVRDL